MNPIALIVVVGAALVAIVLLVRREMGVGGLFGLTVEERAKMLQPIVEYLLRRTFDNGAVGLKYMKGHTATVPARAFAAWNQWKHGSSAEGRAWAMAIGAAREVVNNEYDPVGEIFEGLGAMLAAVLATLAGGPASGAAVWGSYVGQATVQQLELEGKLEEADAYFRQQVAQLDTIESEFHRFWFCRPDAGDRNKLRRGEVGDPDWWDDRQPTSANVATCARFAFADRPRS